jgi:hypothetical protein
MMRSGRKREFQCENCKCTRFAKCSCDKPGSKPVDATHLPHASQIVTPVSLKKEGE